MRNAIYPGSFDPFTNGHKDILDRALRIFDTITVAVVRNPAKKTLFTLKERVDIIKHSVEDISKIEVESFDGLLVDYMRTKTCNVMVKGLRAVSDFEFEFQMALMNRKLDPRVETVFLMTSAEYAFLSSSRVREIASLGGSVSCLVSPYAESRLMDKYKSIQPLGETVEKD